MKSTLLLTLIMLVLFVSSTLSETFGGLMILAGLGVAVCAVLCALSALNRKE